MAEVRWTPQAADDLEAIIDFIAQVSLPNGMATAYSYDNRNRITKIEYKYGATVLNGYTYALDAAGGITRVSVAVRQRARR